MLHRFRSFTNFINCSLLYIFYKVPGCEFFAAYNTRCYLACACIKFEWLIPTRSRGSKLKMYPTRQELKISFLVQSSFETLQYYDK